MKQSAGMRVCFLLVGVILIGITSIRDVEETSGKLKKDSVVTCGGTSYGNHGDGHWHRAVQHSNGWYAEGSSLGKSNPCSTKSNTAPKQSTSSKNSTGVKQSQNNSAAQKAKEVALEKERLEKERLEKERLEKEHLEREKVLSDTSITSFTTVNGVRNVADISILSIMNLDEVSFLLGNTNARISHKLRNAIEPFEQNVIDVEVVSESGLERQKYEISVVILGTNEAFLKRSDVQVVYKGNTFELNQGVLDLGDVDVSTLESRDFSSVSLGDTKHLNVSNIVLEQSSSDSDAYHLKVRVLDYPIEYEIPIHVNNNEETNINLLTAVVPLTSVGILGYGAHRIRKKRRKA